MKKIMAGWWAVAVACGVAAALMNVPPFSIPVDSQGMTRSNAGRPLPKGRLIDGRDGDTLVIDGDERVRIVRRTPAMVRAVFNASSRWLVLIVDYPEQTNGDPDGRVDETFNFRDVTGDWPLGERWEGEAIIEEYSVAMRGPQVVGLRTPQGLVRFSGARDNDQFPDSTIIAVLNTGGSGRTTSPGGSFDEAEQRAVADVLRNLERAARGEPPISISRTTTPTGAETTGVLVGPSITVGPSMTTTSRIASTPGAAVRVGGNVASPKKTYDVPAVLPELARQAGVRGLVILEITVGTDGSVTDAKVLRSIPLLDGAALEAVRQWRYEPTLLSGQPVPVVMTVTVPFR